MQTLDEVKMKLAIYLRFLALPSILLGIAVVSLNGSVLLSGLANNFAALEIVRDLPGIQPENGLPKCGRVGSYFWARRWLDTAIALDPERLVTRLNHGRLAWLEGNCRDSERIYEDVLAARPGDYRAAYWLYWLGGASHDPVNLGISSQDLAGFAWELGNQADRLIAPDAVLAWYELSFRLAPNQSLAYQINNIYRRAGQMEQAFNFLAEVQGRYSEQTPEYWWAAGEIASLKSDWNAASQAFQRAASLASDPYDYLLEQATALQYLGDWAGEEQAYWQAVRARPDSYYPYIGLGQIHRRNSDYEAALSFYHQAETLAPGDFLPQFVIGELYFENSQFEQARAYLERASLLNSRDPYSHYYLAQIFQQTGSYNLAIDALNQAIVLSVEIHPDWLVQLGDLYLALGDPDRALQLYLQAVEHGSADPGLQEIIVRLGSHTSEP